MRTPRTAMSAAMHLPSHRPWLPFPAEGEGGDGGAGGGATGSDGGDSGGATGATGDAGGSTGATGDAGATGTAGKVDDLPDWAQKLIRDTRNEAANHRTKATTAEKAAQEQLDNIAKALGLKKDGTLTAEQLAEKLNSADGKAKSALTELAVHRAANKNGADPEALLDSRGFLAKLTDLDPTADDFGSKVEAAIKDAVKDNPKLKVQAAGAGKSGGEFNGGSGDEGAITDAQLKTMTAEQIADALEKGKLAHLLA